MKLDVHLEFPCTAAAFWNMYWDDDFDEMLMKDATVHRELIDERRDGELLVRRVRFTPHRELPGPVAKLVGSSKLIYEQENRWDSAAGVMHWKVLPTILPGRLTANGEFTVVDTADGCAQVVRGDITVDVRFIGGQIEKAVVEEVRRSYQKTAATCREWLASRGA